MKNKIIDFILVALFVLAIIAFFAVQTNFRGIFRTPTPTVTNTATPTSTHTSPHRDRYAHAKPAISDANIRYQWIMMKPEAFQKMNLIARFRSAARILIKGDPRKNKRNPIPAITREEVAEIKQFFQREKFFIFGHARSGTTLLMRLARLHPEVHCNYQAHFFTRQPLLKSLVNTPEAEEWLARFEGTWAAPVGWRRIFWWMPRWDLPGHRRAGRGGGISGLSCRRCSGPARWR